MRDDRPNPDKLLRQVQEEERKEKRGKLKIYLGAAPGVGKTHEMLHDAKDELQKGLDVVVGVAESHGRAEINSLLTHFEILPKIKIEYRGKELLEFDLVQAIKRHPDLILMDEMAHTNAPLSRHKKRWQDIEELLHRGIDVYTTLNVQHIESVSDDVAQIINAPIKETVPDFMLELADTIELVDLPPEMLLKRLQEGKVYIPAQAEVAAQYFFRKGNLIALRELALRITANQVGKQVLLYREDQGIKHVWPTKEKILVCVGPNHESLKLIRDARQMATGLQAEWLAVYVDTPNVKKHEENRHNAIKNLHLAEQLGARTHVLVGMDVVKEILQFSREQNVTQIMVWKHIKTRWRDFFTRHLADEILRQSGEINVYIVTGMRHDIGYEEKLPIKKSFSWKTYCFAIFMVAFTTLLNIFIFPWASSSDLIMVYLLGVIITARFGQSGPSILASVTSVIAYDFFFIPPYYSFTIPSIELLFTLLTMLVVSQVISQLTIMTRKQAEAAKYIAKQTSALYTLSRQLASSRGTDKLLRIGLDYLETLFDSMVTTLLHENNELKIRPEQHLKKLDEKEQSIAEWVFDLRQVAGLGTDTLSYSPALYMPLLTPNACIGVLRIQPKTQRLFSPDEMRLLEASANQIALALEVDRLQEMDTQSALQNTVDHVRSVLLQSVSHDLRTPLVAVLGSASLLAEMGQKLTRDKVIALGKNIYFEIEQLSRLINNLLQITYLETESVKLKKQLLSLTDVINTVVKTSSKKLYDRKVTIIIPPNLPDIPFDPTLIQEALLNLIDNAVKFTPSGSPIEIIVTLDEQNKNVLISIEDHGPGIVEDEIKKLFEKYYRGRMLTAERGLGLGLAICQKIITAHGGKIWAENRKGGGAVFRFTLPL